MSFFLLLIQPNRLAPGVSLRGFQHSGYYYSPGSAPDARWTGRLPADAKSSWPAPLPRQSSRHSFGSINRWRRTQLFPQLCRKQWRGPASHCQMRRQPIPVLLKLTSHHVQKLRPQSAQPSFPGLLIQPPAQLLNGRGRVVGNHACCIRQRVFVGVLAATPLRLPAPSPTPAIADSAPDDPADREKTHPVPGRSGDNKHPEL